MRIQLGLIAANRPAKTVPDCPLGRFCFLEAGLGRGPPRKTIGTNFVLPPI